MVKFFEVTSESDSKGRKITIEKTYFTTNMSRISSWHALQSISERLSLNLRVPHGLLGSTAKHRFPSPTPERLSFGICPVFQGICLPIDVVFKALPRWFRWRCGIFWGFTETKKTWSQPWGLMLYNFGSILHSLEVVFPICKIREVNDMPFMTAPNLIVYIVNKVNNQDAKEINGCPLKKKQYFKSFNVHIFSGRGN